tara:strand:- start:935 stop:1141 length:207 start_codon:yes stop_codon:yes gene_type:complete
MLDDTSPNIEQNICIKRIEAANKALKVARAAVHGMEMDEYANHDIKYVDMEDDEIDGLLKNNPYGEKT